jgi:hypothetical protein
MITECCQILLNKLYFKQKKVVFLYYTISMVQLLVDFDSFCNMAHYLQICQIYATKNSTMQLQN